MTNIVVQVCTEFTHMVIDRKKHKSSTFIWWTSRDIDLLFISSFFCQYQGKSVTSYLLMNINNLSAMAVSSIVNSLSSGFLPVNAYLIYLCKRSRTNASISLQNGVHWYFRFAVKTADNRVKLLKYKDSKQM